MGFFNVFCLLSFKFKQKMEIKNYLDCKCKKGCCEGLSENTVMDIRAKYAETFISNQAGDEFIASCMENEDVRVRRANRMTDARQKTTSYTVEHKGVLHKVCRVAFGLVYGITQKKITIVRNKKEKNDLAYRRGHTKHQYVTNIFDVENKVKNNHNALEKTVKIEQGDEKPQNKNSKPFDSFKNEVGNNTDRERSPKLKKHKKKGRNEEENVFGIDKIEAIDLKQIASPKKRKMSIVDYVVENYTNRPENVNSESFVGSENENAGNGNDKDISPKPKKHKKKSRDEDEIGSISLKQIASPTKCKMSILDYLVENDTNKPEKCSQESNIYSETELSPKSKKQKRERISGESQVNNDPEVLSPKLKKHKKKRNIEKENVLGSDETDVPVHSKKQEMTNLEHFFDDEINRSEAFPLSLKKQKEMYDRNESSQESILNSEKDLLSQKPKKLKRGAISEENYPQESQANCDNEIVPRKPKKHKKKKHYEENDLEESQVNSDHEVICLKPEKRKRHTTVLEPTNEKNVFNGISLKHVKKSKKHKRESLQKDRIDSNSEIVSPNSKKHKKKSNLNIEFLRSDGMDKISSKEVKKLKDKKRSSNYDLSPKSKKHMKPTPDNFDGMGVESLKERKKQDKSKIKNLQENETIIQVNKINSDIEIISPNSKKHKTKTHDKEIFFEQIVSPKKIKKLRKHGINKHFEKEKAIKSEISALKIKKEKRKNEGAGNDYLQESQVVENCERKLSKSKKRQKELLAGYFA